MGSKDKYIIEGGHKLEGEVRVAGAKNAILGIIPAAILAKGTTTIENVPHIKDVETILDILKGIGAKVDFHDSVLEIDTSYIDGKDLKPFNEKFENLRASYYLWGALIGRNGETTSSLPGGCDIGDRQVGLHLKGFRKLGTDVTQNGSYLSFKVTDELRGADIYFDVASVGATINIMLASALADGVTTIENAAKEPHVVDVANFLNRMGANIKGAGTDRIKITGVDELKPCCYEVIPDQIVAGTYMIAAAVTEGDVTVKDVIPKHLESLTSKLREMGAHVEVNVKDKSVRVRGKRPYIGTEIKTNYYPGFPTDLQQPLAVLMTLAEGDSKIEENLFSNRFAYISDLIRMGADADLYDNVCVIHGGKALSGVSMKAKDLRAGAAMVLAGLCADGESNISDVHIIDRGYENFEDGLSKLGAVIKRVKATEE